MNVASALNAAALVAAEKNLTEDDVRAGLIGLFFFVGLFVATYFLWRSMNKQLKKVDAHFEAIDPDEVRQGDALSVQEKIAEGQAAMVRRSRPAADPPAEDDAAV